MGSSESDINLPDQSLHVLVRLDLVRTEPEVVGKRGWLGPHKGSGNMLSRHRPGRADCIGKGAPELITNETRTTATSLPQLAQIRSMLTVRQCRRDKEKIGAAQRYSW